MSDNEQNEENRETIADIVAMLRANAKGERFDEFSFTSLADRIEAAWKRERAKVEADALEAGGIVEAARTAEKSSAVGNAAAMREALIALVEYSELAMKMGVFNREHLSSVVSKARAALSAPARNCDLYDDAEIAWRAWLDDKDNWDEFGSPKLELHEWLLAKSAERKGVIHE